MPGRASPAGWRDLQNRMRHVGTYDDLTIEMRSVSGTTGRPGAMTASKRSCSRWGVDNVQQWEMPKACPAGYTQVNS
jgi:hypothetical protein